jgi:hypothetical protein
MRLTNQHIGTYKRWKLCLWNGVEKQGKYANVVYLLNGRSAADNLLKELGDSGKMW